MVQHFQYGEYLKMNKNIIIASVILLGLIAIVLAQGIGEGDIITQAQLDSINASTINLQCQLEDIGQSHIIQSRGNWYFYRNVSCLSIQPIPLDEHTNDYLIIRPNHYPNFLVSDYFACRQNNNAQYCNQFYTNELIEQHQENKQAIRNKIRRFQTVEGDSEDTDYEDGFGL